MQESAVNIIKKLKSYHKEGGVTLDAETPFQLLVATILSAQCTDLRVNMVTKTLFKKFGTPESLANASFDEVVDIIKSLGFFNQKAKFIIEAAKKIVSDYNGKVPNSREALQSLPGVGRKTANIVLSRAFNVPAIAVDTHVKRLSKRIFGLKENNPDAIEKALMEIFPENVWNDVNLTFIFHGRTVCKPQKPLCDKCPINNYCKYFNSKEKKYGHDRN